MGELESDLDTEGRKSAEIVKAARKAGQRTADAAEKLNGKLKKMRLTLEEAEQNNLAWQAKYKKAVVEMEEAEERAEAAESQLQKTRQRMKSGGASLAPTRGTSAAASRQRSR